MNEIVQEAKRIASEYGFDVKLPELDIGQKCKLSDVWDGEGETPEEDYSYELGHGDFLNYEFKTLTKCENELDNVIMIRNIWIG